MVVTTPEALTVAMAVALLDQTPPDVEEAYVVVAPIQIDAVPVIAATVGNGLTVIIFITVVEQPPLVTVYNISTEPAEIPLTTPPEVTVAIPVPPLDHTPPAVVELNVVDEPIQTVAAPVIAATVGNALTRIDLVTGALATPPS